MNLLRSKRMVEIKAPDGRVIGLMEEGPLADLVTNLVGAWMARDKTTAIAILFRDEPYEHNGDFFAKTLPGNTCQGPPLWVWGATGTLMMNVKCEPGQKFQLV